MNTIILFLKKLISLFFGCLFMLVPIGQKVNSIEPLDRQNLKLGLGKRDSNPIWFWRHIFANISLKMLGIHKVFLRFLPHLGRKSDRQNCFAP